MFHVVQAQFTVFEPFKRPEDDHDGAETLRRSCLHPAEAWALKRRATRPQAPSRRLPVVAPVG